MTLKIWNQGTDFTNWNRFQGNKFHRMFKKSPRFHLKLFGLQPLFMWTSLWTRFGLFMLMLSIVLHIEIIKPSRDSLLCSVEFREKI